MKYWDNGAPYIITEGTNSSSDTKYWNNGSPLIISTTVISGEISVADKTWSTIKKIGGVIIAAIKKIGGVTP